MDFPRFPDGDADPEGASAYEQAARFRTALRVEIQRLDAERDRLHDELVEQQEHRHRRAGVTERALGAIDAELANVNRMLSELDRQFPEG